MATGASTQASGAHSSNYVSPAALWLRAKLTRGGGLSRGQDALSMYTVDVMVPDEMASGSLGFGEPSPLFQGQRVLFFFWCANVC